MSKHSRQEEDLPAAMSIIGAQGSDVALAKLVGELMAEEDDISVAGVNGDEDEEVKDGVVVEGEHVLRHDLLSDGAIQMAHDHVKSVWL